MDQRPHTQGEISSLYLKALEATQKILSTDKIVPSVFSEINDKIIELTPQNIPQRTSKQCNVTWSTESIAYKCRDCQFDSTCVVCVDCFQNADHTGHDYSIIKTGGGCCDCGDAEAWDPKGFCSNHSSSIELPHPSEILDKDLADRFLAAIQAGCEVIHKCNSYQFQSRLEKRKLTRKCISIISWMESLCVLVGDAAKWTIGKVFYTPFQNFEIPFGKEQLTESNRDKNLLLSLFLQDEYLSPEVREELHKLYFTLLGETEFKEQFARNFIKCYMFQLQAIGTGNRKELLAFSVQLFSTPSLVPLFIESGFLNQLYKRFEELFRRIMVHEESGAVRMKWTNGILRKGYYSTLLYDLRYLLSLKDISRYILYNDEKGILLNFVKLYSELNEGQVHVRVPPPRDCLDDDGTWGTCWTLEEHLISLVSKLSKGFEIVESSTVQTRAASIEKLRLIIHQALNYIEQFSRTRTITINNETFEQVKFRVSKDKVSLSIPLHKFLAIFLNRAINKYQIPLSEIITGIENKFTTFLIEHPLRLQALYSQVAAKMWARNGIRFQWVVQMQRYSVKYYTHVPKDIFLIQCCAVSMSPAALFSIIQDRFELTGATYFHPKDSNCNAEWTVSQITTLVEHFLEFLAILITNRTMVGQLTQEEKIQQFMMHFLFLRNFTHSELMNNSLNEYTKHPKLKQIISQVADFDTKPMNNGEPGVYNIKPQMWNFLDPYFLHYSLSDFQEVQDRYFSIQKTQIIPIPIPSEVSPSFQGLWTLLQSRHLHRILFWSLLYAAESHTINSSSFVWSRNLKKPEKGAYTSITCIHHSLRLLFLACACRSSAGLSQISISSSIFSDSSEIFLKASQLPYEHDDIAINILQEFTTPNFQPEQPPLRYSLLSILQKIHQSQEPLRGFIDLIFEKLKQENLSICNLTDNSPEKEKSLKSDSEKRKAFLAQQAAKQKKIMANFKNQQEAFLKSSAELFAELDDDLMDDEHPVCAVCKDTCLPTLERPVGRLAYQQRTKLTQLHRAKNNGAPVPSIPLESISSFRSDQFRYRDALHHLGFRLDNAALQNLNELRPPGPINPPAEETDEETSTEISQTVWEEIVTPNASLDLHFCQHTIHISCFQTYYDSLIQQARRLLGYSFDIQSNEFCCPTCRSLSNIIIPLPPAELLSLPENPNANSNSDSDKAEESKSMPSLKQYTLMKNVYDTFTMNCSLVYNLKVPKYYIPFHAAYDVFYISAIRSKIECIELSTRRDNLIPPVSILAENRPVMQQLYQSALGYKKCCQIDLNYNDKTIEQCSLSFQHMIFGKDSFQFPFTPNQLMECDLFAILSALVFYSEPKIQLQEFDKFVQILFAAQIFQIIRAKKSKQRSNTSEIQMIKSHPYVDELVTMIFHCIPKNSNCCEILDLNELLNKIFDEAFEFIRKVYILRHTLFDIFFSDLPSEDSSAPFADLCEVILSNPQQLELSKSIQLWISSENVLPVPSFAPFQFIDLPKEYIFAYDKKYTSFVCQECKEEPRKPALCLLCGIIVCADSSCCSRDGYGECNRHAQNCGETGVFLLLYSTMILLLHHGKGCLWDSLYVDEHGEIDENLARGKELYLNEIKLRELYSICVHRQIPAICNKKANPYRRPVFWEQY